MNGFTEAMLESLAIDGLDNIIDAAADFFATDNIRTLALNDFSVFVRQNGLDPNYKVVSTMLAAVRHYYDTGDASLMRPAFGPFVTYAASYHAHRVAQIALAERKAVVASVNTANSKKPRAGSQRISNEELVAALLECYPNGEFDLDAPPSGHLELLLAQVQASEPVDKKHKAQSLSSVSQAIKRLRGNRTYFSAKYHGFLR